MMVWWLFFAFPFITKLLSCELCHKLCNALVGVGESYFTVFCVGLLIQLDDRNREIEQLKSQLKNLELEKSFKGRPQLKPALL